MAEDTLEADVTYKGESYIPVFPLPNVVLYPRILQPLHIFEPRYRLMLSEVLDSHGRIAMALTRRVAGDEPPEVYSVMGVGHVTTYEARPDGTSNIFLLGELRAVATDWNDGPHYRRARLEPLREVPPPSTSSRDQLRRELKDWLTRLTEGWDESGDFKKLQQVFSRQDDVGFLVDFLAYHFLEEPRDRQALLEELEVEKRAESLRKSLDSRWPV